MWTFARAAAAAALIAGCGKVEDPPVDVSDRQGCNGQPVNVLLENGNFDLVAPPWREEPAGLLCGLPRIMPDSGDKAACMGGGLDNSVESVSREVTLPLGATKARLTGKICIATDETDALDNDVISFDLLDGATPIAELGRRSNRQGMASCSFVNFSLEQPLPRDPEIATLRIQSKLDIGKSTSFFVDTLQLIVTCD